MTQSNVAAPLQIMRLPEVIATVGLSRPSIYRLKDAGAFPKQIKLGASSVGWLRAEIEAWIAARVSARDSQALLAA